MSKLLISAIALVSIAAAPEKTTLGTRKNPIKFVMVPSSDAGKILDSMKPVAKCLEKETGLVFDVSVPNNYIVVVEGLGSSKVDVAMFNTFGYLLAHERYGADAILKVTRKGESTYQGQILVRADGKIKKLEDLMGKKIAYVDPASTSGYILPKKLLLDKKVKVAEEVFAGKHDVAATMLYQGQVDAAATYYNVPLNGKIRDARERISSQFPDVEQKLKILELTLPIANDPIAVRKDIDADTKDKISKGFMACVIQHKDAFMGINNSDGLVPVKDADYDGIRATIKELKINLGDELTKKK